MTDRAFISGITGKDDAYVAGFLVENGYEVHGVKRRASTKGFPFDTCRKRARIPIGGASTA
jgi:GDP-D-mannose dehydratase